MFEKFKKIPKEDSIQKEPEISLEKIKDDFGKICEVADRIVKNGGESDKKDLGKEKKVEKEDISYYKAKEIIERETTVVDETGAEIKPNISFSREKDESKIVFELNKDIDLVTIFSTLVKTVGKINVSDLGSDSFCFRNDNSCIYLWKETFYSPAKIEFIIKTDIKDEEIEAIIKTYKIGHNVNSEGKKQIEAPQKILESLGATIFKAENAPDWDFLAGYEKTKQQVKETIISPLLNPEIYDQIAQMTRKTYQSIRPKAVLFEGPPGTGKTTMARLIAGETKSTLIYVPVETIMSKWYGESEKNLKDIFNACDNLDKCILFLDEIDSLATNRDGNMHEATRRVLSVLLREIDGFNQNKSTILIGATNRKNDLDSALLSRFNISIEFALPKKDERKAIIKNYAQHLNDETLLVLAEKTEEKSGRDIKNLCERVERSWASELITKKEEIITFPPAEKYLIEVEN